MPTKKAAAMTSLSGLIDSDGDVDMMPSPDSNQENEPIAKAKKLAQTTAAKPKGRPPGKMTANTKAKATKGKAAASKRAPLQEQANEQQPSDAEDDFDDLADESRAATHHAAQDSEPEALPKKQAVRRGRPPGKAKQAPTEKTAAAKVKATERDGEFEYTPTRSQPERATSKGKKASRAQDERVDYEEDEQEDAQDEDTMLSIEEDDVVGTSGYKKTGPARKAPVQSSSTQPSSRRRVESTAEPEQGGDPALRRKLGEMTRKFEALESRYRNLKEIGVVEAEANFDRLRKQSEQRTKAANDLIESLRNELEAQRALSQQAREQDSDLHVMQKSLSASEGRVSELTSALNASRKENQTLQAKLIAARNGSEANAQRGPASASKSSVAIGANSSHAMQMLQLKEDLYSDLTGLIIRSVSKHDDMAIYDCIQTGCNGTLHFKLSVAPEENASSFEETEFQYEPRLDRSRDQDLIDIMPEYLSEEIIFSRANAAKFYSRIADTLTKRLIDD